uniref:DUF7787 domain-containing protein n=1 Tax=Davidia involucrata TaxID=16924 RepID=A0A5B7C292_DAVIN
MELLSPQPSVRMRRTQKISLEEYVNFIDSQKQIDLTVNHLNQIIEMHGFKKIHKAPKRVLIDAVNSIDLVDPSRSTLEDNNISSCAFITSEEAIKDLADLNWQECSVTFIQTLNSVNYDLNLQNADPDSLKPKSKSRRRKKMRRLGGVDGINATTGCVGGGSQSACSSAVGGDGGAKKKLIPKRKKNVKKDGGFGATVGDFSSSSSLLSPY